MKNIFILPTDQPSKLGYISESKTYHLYNNDVFLDELANAINIYITSDEEIKEGNWYLDTTVNVIFKNDKLFLNGTGYKKIILTTDPTLIADGVQSIDDEFLEWFVKNPSCDFIEVELECFYQGKCVKERCLTYCCDEKQYKIIIPQEEAKGEKKPHSFCETPEEKCTMNYCDDNGCQNRKRHLVEPHEQEILPEFTLSKNIFDKISDLPKGETSYSEDEVLELLKKSHFVEQNIEEWFNQNKKK
jgi:hypothetical protein